MEGGADVLSFFGANLPLARVANTHPARRTQVQTAAILEPGMFDRNSGGQATRRTRSPLPPKKITIADLPVEMLTEIINFSFRDPVSSVIIPFVCHLWNEVAQPLTKKFREQPTTDPKYKLLTGLTRREKLFGYCFSLTAETGNLGLLKWFKEKGCPSAPTHASISAAKNGHLEVLKWLWEVETGGGTLFRKIFDEVTCHSAAGNGHLEVVKWLREVAECPWDRWTFSQAARGGHIELLRWAKDNGCPIDPGACALAAESGHLEVLKWLREEDCPWDQWTCAHAAEGGHLDVLKWARENGCIWDDATCYYAAATGQLHVLEWVITENSVYEIPRLLGIAASKGQQHILEWMSERHYMTAEIALEVDLRVYAAEGGHLQLLKWLYEKGYGVEDKDICSVAAKKGHLHVLKWAREVAECPWDRQECLRMARMKERKNVLEWIEKKGK